MRPSRFMSCDDYVKIMAEKTPPYNDPFMFDYSWQDEQAYKTGIYSDHKAKLVAWHQHYQTFYKESVLFCDFAFGSYINFMTWDKPSPDPCPECGSIMVEKSVEGVKKLICQRESCGHSVELENEKREKVLVKT